MTMRVRFGKDNTVHLTPKSRITTDADLCGEFNNVYYFIEKWTHLTGLHIPDSYSVVAADVNPILERLNSYTHIHRLCISPLNRVDWSASYMRVNTTISDLAVRWVCGPDESTIAFNGSDATLPQFIKWLSQNTVLTSLYLHDSVQCHRNADYVQDHRNGDYVQGHRNGDLVQYHNPDNKYTNYVRTFADYISTNTILKSLHISIIDYPDCVILINSLRENLCLTALTLGLCREDQRRGYRNKVMYGSNEILKLIATTTTLRSLTFTHFIDKTVGVEELARSLVRNTSINHLTVALDKGRDFDTFVELLSANITLTSIHNTCKLKLYDIPMTRSLMWRNRHIQWRKVHPRLLNFTLIFHFLPPYLILEIFDWLMHMYLVKHYTKIKLICAVKRSISAVRTIKN